MSTPELYIMSEAGDILPPDEVIFPAVEEWIPDHYVGSSTDTTPLDEIEETNDEQLDVVSDVSRLPELTRIERLTSLKRNEEFYPQNNREFNRMMLMSSNAEGDLRALIHLDEVFAHQNKETTETDDPKAALRSIVREFENYAASAKAEGFFQRELHTRLGKSGASNFTVFKNIPQLQSWKDEPGTRRALTLLAKRREIGAYIEGTGKDPLSKRAIIDTAKDKDKRIGDLVNNLRVTDLNRMGVTLVGEQAHRFAYWTERLREATRHYYVRGQGYAALRSLGVIK